MKYPNMEITEQWEEKKKRVLSDLTKKGEDFIKENLKKLKEYEKNEPNL